MDDHVNTELPEVETEPDDPRTWVREYVTIGAVQGDFREPSAVAVVERAQHPTNPEALAYLVRQVEELPADAAIQNVAEFAGKLATKAGACRCVLDATTAGAPMLREWAEHFGGPREFYPLHIGDRERPELSTSRRFTLTTANRLDLLGAVRMALGVTGGLIFHSRARTKQADAKAALDEYVATLPNLTPEEEEWAPPPTWHLVLALALGVWQLMEQPADLRRNGLDTDSLWDRDYRLDRRYLRDMSVIENRQRIERDAARARGELIMPDPYEIIERRRARERATSRRMLR